MDIISAIIAINPDAQVSVNAEDYDQIIWHGDTPVISKADIVAKQAELKADYDAKEYQRNRRAAYPTWEQQMDILYHSGVDGLKTELKKTKDKYPKA
jgi:hypothetical protein